VILVPLHPASPRLSKLIEPMVVREPPPIGMTQDDSPRLRRALVTSFLIAFALHELEEVLT
jgi:hypothetical protein